MNPDTSTEPSLLIGGRERQGRGRLIEGRNPATGEPTHRLAGASREDVALAVRTAREAMQEASWAALLPHQRAAILHRISDAIAADAGRFADLQMRDNGKVRAECLAQARSAAATFRYFAGACETMESSLTPSRGDYLSMSVHEPYGVVAALTPWNSPLTMEAQKVAPGLAAGNAVILQPSGLRPSGALALGRVALEAGLPPGILNVLAGWGDETGAALVEHPGVDMVSFTGGTATGRRIAQVAAGKLMHVALELGGKSPQIVFADADLEAAVRGAADGIFEGSGQSCVAGSRLFVQRAALTQVRDAVVARARALRMDLPDADGAQMGPLASFDHRARVEWMVAQAREEGATILAGGRRPDQSRLSQGAFYEPTVIGDIDNRSRIAQEEIFGPVLCVLAFDDEDDLVAQANDSDLGLAAGIWCRDFAKAWRVARRLQAGTVWINTYKQLSIATPFGGFKQSGLGREKGLSGIRLYQQAKGIYIGL